MRCSYQPECGVDVFCLSVLLDVLARMRCSVSRDDVPRMRWNLRLIDNLPLKLPECGVAINPNAVLMCLVDGCVDYRTRQRKKSRALSLLLMKMLRTKKK